MAVNKPDALAGAVIFKRLLAFDDAAASAGERTAHRVMIDWLVADLSRAELERLPVDLSFYRSARTLVFDPASAPPASPEERPGGPLAPDKPFLTDLTLNPDDDVFNAEALEWPLPPWDGPGSDDRAEQTRRAIIGYLNHITWGQSVCDPPELARRIDRAAQRLHEVALRVLAVYDVIVGGEVDMPTWETPHTPDNSDEDMPF